jgi:hypothetical protein
MPLLVLANAWLVQSRFEKRPNSAPALFVFLTCLDFVYLLKRDTAVPRINHQFASVYSAVFEISALVSFLFVIIAASAQGRIHKHLIHKHRGPASPHYYPLGIVSLCWLVALASITFHLVLLFGGQR